MEKNDPSAVSSTDVTVKNSFILVARKLNMNEEDKYEDPTERRNLRFKYRELITETERRLIYP